MTTSLFVLIVIIVGLWQRDNIEQLYETTILSQLQENKEPMVMNLRPANITLAKQYALYASTGFCSDEQLTQWDCKACSKVKQPKFVSSFNNRLMATRGYVALDNNLKKIFIIFRGSSSPINYAYDIISIPSKHKVIEEHPLAMVSIGFLKCMQSLEEQFIKILDNLLKNKKYKDYKLCFIGHSLGGAMASLALIEAQQQLDLSFDQLELFTYGQPRTGNRKFATWFNQQNITVARTVNQNDLVPLTPFKFLYDYTHHGVELFINSNNNNAHYCRQDIDEDPECGASFDIRNFSGKQHVNYFDAEMTKEAAC